MRREEKKEGGSLPIVYTAKAKADLMWVIGLWENFFAMEFFLSPLGRDNLASSRTSRSGENVGRLFGYRSVVLPFFFQRRLGLLHV